MAEMMRIAIAKGGKGAFIDVDPDVVNSLPPEVFAKVIEEGLKVFLNAKMSKLQAPTQLEGKELEDNKAAALKIAADNLESLKEGKLTKRTAGAKASTGEKREVTTEAMRLAKEVVKNEIKKAGMKISHVPLKDITTYAKSLVESDPTYVTQAKANLAERATISTGRNITDLIKESPALIAKAEKRKAERKVDTDQSSAKQAGGTVKHGTVKVPPRRGDQPHQAH